MGIESAIADVVAKEVVGKNTDGVVNTIADIARTASKALMPSKPPHEGYSEVFIQTKLAVEFGDEDTLSDWVASLDKELSTAAFFAVKEIKQKKAFEWESCVAALNNCDALIQEKDSHRRHSDKWSKSTDDFFKVDGSPDSEDVKQLESWFKGSICKFNPKIYENSELVQKGVITRLAKIASETGARISSFEKLFHATDSHRDKVLEISVIRFPTKDNPHLLLYRLVVDAFFQCSRTLAWESNKSGFEYDIQEMKFKLNPDIVDSIRDEHVDKFKNKLEDASTYEW